MWDSCHLWYSFIFSKYVETILEIFLFFYCVLLQHYVTLRLHQISGKIFSLCFNAHRNPSQDFISEFHLLFQQRLLRFLMKLLVHRSFQWFPALIQLHFHRTNDTVLLNLITFSHHIIFLHCFFILKMLKYIQIVSISDSSREETYGNKQHTNFKWGTEFSHKRQRC